MNIETADAYTIPALAGDGVQPGTNLLLTGPSRLTSQVADRLVLEGRDAGTGTDEGAIVVSTNVTGRNFVRKCRGQYPEMDLRRVGFVDATGRADIDVDTRMQLRSVSGTGDLTGVSIRISVLHSELTGMGCGRIRYCYNSLSLFLLYTDPKTVTRFVHTVGGRISATDGLGVFGLDPAMHDRRVVKMLEHSCDGRIRIRMNDGELKHRVEGLPTYSEQWRPLDR